MRTVIYFTSDLHFSHYNIIKYCNRPFESVDKMNNILINNWNKIVKENDEVYILGDITLGDNEKYLNRLKGSKYLIKGNHDKIRTHENLKWVKDYYELKYNKHLCAI